MAVPCAEHRRDGNGVSNPWPSDGPVSRTRLAQGLLLFVLALLTSIASAVPESPARGLSSVGLVSEWVKTATDPSKGNSELHALSGTIRRIPGFLIAGRKISQNMPKDLNVSLAAPSPYVKLNATARGWDLVVDARQISANTDVLVRLKVTSASRGYYEELEASVKVIPAVSFSYTIPAGGAKVSIGDRMLEFPPQARSPQKVFVSHGLIPGTDARIVQVEAYPLRGLPSEPEVGKPVQYKVYSPWGTESAPDTQQLAATSLLEELDNTVPYSSSAGVLAKTWRSYTAPYIEKGTHRLPAASGTSVDSRAGELNSLVTDGWTRESWLTVTPVLFVHGYVNHVTSAYPYFGGGKSTYGEFPNLVRRHQGSNGTRFAPFEYRWNSDAQFTVQGRDLADAIRMIKNRTGRNVVIVAHSMGGLLVRAVLQGQVGSDLVSVKNSVSMVLTLGTPHSGISDTAGIFHGVELPVGQDSLAFLGCLQISCHVAGEYVDLDFARLGISDLEGQDVALLFQTRAKLPAIKLAQGVGVDQDQSLTSSKWTYQTGDGLISLEGQHLFPDESKAAFRSWSGVTGSSVQVREQVLGHLAQSYKLSAGLEAPSSRLFAKDPWSRAYFHTSNVFSYESGAGMEANIPGAVSTTCNSPLTCQHASWRLLVELIGSRGNMNDTGQIACLSPSGTLDAVCAGSGQDGDYGRDVSAPQSSDGAYGFSFVKIGPGGEELPSNATTWSCVMDKTTGLMWEVKTTDGGLRDVNKVYYYWGGETQKFVNDVNATGLCGVKDWRVPTVAELFGIVNHGKPVRNDLYPPPPLIDLSWFPHISERGSYQSSIVLPDNPQGVWGVDFSQGTAGPGAGGSVMLVRSINYSIGSPATRFTINGGEALDSTTGLIWKRCIEGYVWTGTGCSGADALFTWQTALARAKEVASATGLGWRLPNAKELFTIVDTSRTRPAADFSVFPSWNTQGYEIFFSNSPYLQKVWPIGSSVVTLTGMRGVEFWRGYSTMNSFEQVGKVRLVRDSQ